MRAQKILFIEFAEMRQGDGKGPKYLPGKVYWLRPDQAERWKAEGVAEDAPEGMDAENEPPVPILRPDHIRIVRNGRSRHDVLGPDGEKLNDEPLTAHEAEKLRQRMIGTEYPGMAARSSAAPAQQLPEQSALQPIRDVAMPFNSVESVYEPTPPQDAEADFDAR